MNLIGDPWIPVVFQDGTTRSVGMNELYQQSENIRDLALAPPQRIAVMRLIICITQAALDGPEDINEWRNCAQKIAPQSLDYLENRRSKFNLFGETPFMQIKDLGIDNQKNMPALDKLDFGLASGNNKTLFDQEANPDGREHPAAWAAIHLLTFLNFSTGGKVGQAKWMNQQFSDAAKAAPALHAAHLFPKGKNLCETIRFNLLTKKQALKLPNGKWGEPVWDQYPKSPSDQDAIENATQTYLGRLVPLTRLIKIFPQTDTQNILQAKCIIGPPVKELGFEGPPTFREPSTALIANADPQRPYVYLTVSVDKHIWRELGALLILNEAQTEAGGPPILQNLKETNEEYIDIWIGGLIPSKADIEDAVEWNLAIPGIVLQGDQILTRYQQSVTLSENAANSLSKAIRTYLDELNAYKGNDPRSKNARQGIVKRAQTLYWQMLEQRYEILFSESITIDQQWKNIILEALKESYSQFCLHETPRQIKAFAAGQKRLDLWRFTEKGEENA